MASSGASDAMQEKATKLSIKQWSADDRPREKTLSKGIGALSDAELLALLIGSGNAEETAVELSRRILNDNGNDLNRLARLSINDLCRRFKGIGTAKAITIAAALELGRRRKSAVSDVPPQLTSSQAAFEVFFPLLTDLQHEEVWIALLNRSLHLITTRKVSQGGRTASMTDVRIILKEAIEYNAVALILAHNHPSGSTTPSSEDMQLTHKLHEAARLLDLQLTDHIIIGGAGYYSFSDNGLI